MLYTTKEMLLSAGIIAIIINLAILLFVQLLANIEGRGYKSHEKKEGEMVANYVWSDKFGRRIKYGFMLDGDAYEWNDKLERYVNEGNCYERYTPEQADLMVRQNRAHWI